MAKSTTFDFVVTPKLDFCDKRPQAILDPIMQKILPSLEEKFSTLPSATTDLTIYSSVPLIRRHYLAFKSKSRYHLMSTTTKTSFWARRSLRHRKARNFCLQRQCVSKRHKKILQSMMHKCMKFQRQFERVVDRVNN